MEDPAVPMTAFDLATEKYLGLLDALQQAAIATDLNGTILHWSESATRLYGWNREEAVGKNVVDMTPAELSRSEAAEIMTRLGAGELWSGEFMVRSKSGDSFRASVTDVPLIAESGEVAGIIGVSAPSRSETELRALLSEFVDACNRQWRGRVELQEIAGDLRVDASDPHLVQLLALLMQRHASALESGAKIEIRAEKADAATLSSLGAPRNFSGVYLRIADGDDRPRFSVLRDLKRAAFPADYAASLVRMLGGRTIEGALPNEPRAIHLLLPRLQ